MTTEEACKQLQIEENNTTTTLKCKTRSNLCSASIFQKKHRRTSIVVLVCWVIHRDEKEETRNTIVNLIVSRHTFSDSDEKRICTCKKRPTCANTKSITESVDSFSLPFLIAWTIRTAYLFHTKRPTNLRTPPNWRPLPCTSFSGLLLYGVSTLSTLAISPASSTSIA